MAVVWYTYTLSKLSLCRHLSEAKSLHVKHLADTDNPRGKKARKCMFSVQSLSTLYYVFRQEEIAGRQQVLSYVEDRVFFVENILLYF